MHVLRAALYKYVHNVISPVSFSAGWRVSRSLGLGSRKGAKRGRKPGRLAGAQRAFLELQVHQQQREEGEREEEEEEEEKARRAVAAA